MLLLTGLAFAAPTPADVTAELAKVIPLVEQVTDRTFTAIPPLKFAAPGQTEQALSDEMAQTLAHRYPSLSAPSVARMADAMGGWMLHAIIGKYGYLAKTLFVRPLGLRDAERAAGVHDIDETGALDVVLAHELTHALQDQELGFGARSDAAPTIDAWRAQTALWEGHAVLVAAEVAARLGHPTAAAEGMTLQGLGGEAPTASNLDFWFNYRTSAVYLTAKSAEPTRAWDLLAEPPVTTAEVFARARARPATHVEVPAVQAVAATRLGFSDWPTLHRDQGELDLRRALGCDPAAVAAVVGGLIGGDSWSSMGSNGANTEVVVWEFVDQSSARALYDALYGTALASVKAVAGSRIPTTVKVTPATESAFEITVEVIPTSGLPNEAHSGIGVSERNVVQVSMFGARPKPGALMDALAASLLESAP